MIFREEFFHRVCRWAPLLWITIVFHLTAYVLKFFFMLLFLKLNLVSYRLILECLLFLVAIHVFLAQEVAALVRREDFTHWRDAIGDRVIAIELLLMCLFVHNGLHFTQVLLIARQKVSSHNPWQHSFLKAGVLHVQVIHLLRVSSLKLEHLSIEAFVCLRTLNATDRHCRLLLHRSQNVKLLTRLFNSHCRIFPLELELWSHRCFLESHCIERIAKKVMVFQSIEFNLFRRFGHEFGEL